MMKCKIFCLALCLLCSLGLLTACHPFPPSSDPVQTESNAPEEIPVPASQPEDSPASEPESVVSEPESKPKISLVGTWVWNEDADTVLVFQEDFTFCRYSGNEILKGTYSYKDELELTLTEADGTTRTRKGTVNEQGHLQIADTSGLFTKESDSTTPPKAESSANSEEQSGTLQTKGLWLNETAGMSLQFPSSSEAIFTNLSDGSSETVSYEFDGLTYIFLFPNDRIETAVYDADGNLLLIGTEGVFVCGD